MKGLDCACCRGFTRCRYLTAWMMLRVQIFQALARDVRVDLSGRQITVPEEHLHDAQIRSVVQQVGRKRMAQRVGREAPSPRPPSGVTLDDVPERLTGHPVTAAGRERGRRSAARAGSPRAGRA